MVTFSSTHIKETNFIIIMSSVDVFSSLKYVVAPMVSQSDAPFRSLCLKYGATVAYTEMLYSDKVVNDPDYLDAFLPEADGTFVTNEYKAGPLVVQICGNDADLLAKTAVKIATSGRGVDAIDLNLGCPQDRARDGLFGSFLLDKQHWERVFTCVKACSESLAPFNVPMFCKIRLIKGGDAVELTTKFCRYYTCHVCAFSTAVVFVQIFRTLEVPHRAGVPHL